MQMYTIKKEKLVEKEGEEPRKYYHEIGTLLIRDGGQNGALWLHHLDGEFALFLKEPKAEGASPEPHAQHPGAGFQGRKSRLIKAPHHG